ncbi:MAG: exo-beta-N-acetylmuramidase NamZ family protein [Thermodesulfobacteriota bacterium]
MNRVISGLEVFVHDPPAWVKGARLGLLSHPASVDADLVSARELLASRFPGQLRVLFSPQHGLLGEKQDNMISSPDFLDAALQLPVISLYGPRMAPPPDSLEKIDAVLVDLQDVGARVYTFAATVAKVMEAAAAAGVKVAVLDRPNPIGGAQVEGNMLKPGWASFVGPYPLPMRHGLTLGELARYYNVTQKLGCDLEVIPAKGWRRRDYFEATGLPWVLPSPNLPTLDSAVVYPGQVLLEGTNLSEGRGATRPFELFGAPFLDPARIKVRLEKIPLPGVILREVSFEPTFHKWAGELCRGFQLHVTDRLAYKPYFTTLALLGVIRELYPDDFAWRQPPYEYETERRPIDLLTGDAAIREGLEQGTPVRELEAAWQEELARFREARQEFLLYPE